MNVKKFVLYLFFILFCSGCKSFTLAPGQIVPNIELQNVEDNSLVTVHSLLTKPSLLVFFASWCVVCQEDSRQLSELNDRMSKEGFSVIAIALEDDITDTRKFVTRLQPRYPVYFENKGVLKKMLKISGFPEAFLVDQHKQLSMFQSEGGELRMKFIGAQPWTAPEYLTIFRSMLPSSQHRDG